MSIFSIFKRNEHIQIADHPRGGAPPAVTPAPPQARQLPPLILLTSDAAGPSVRTVHTFPDAESAADFVHFWFPLSERGRLVSFWATHQRPALPPVGDTNGEAASPCAMADAAPPLECEAVVLVRHPRHEDSVYPFSFGDLETANRFVIEEMKRGLDLRSVRIYWATFCRIDSTPDGGVLITPPNPPPAAHPEPKEANPIHTARPEPRRREPRRSEPAQTPPDSPKRPRADADPLPAYEPTSSPTTLSDILRDLAEALSAEGNRPGRAFGGFGSPPGRF